MKPISIYLAGPDVFFPCDLESGKKKIELCKELDVEGIYPSFLLPEGLFTEKYSKKERQLIINEECKNGILKCDFLIANLTPFRGFEMDSGTAFEIGFANALDRPIYAYSNSPFSYLERMQKEEGTYCDSNGAWRDKDNNVIEDFNLTENCMISASCVNLLQPTLEEVELIKQDSMYMFRKTLNTIVNDFTLEMEHEKNLLKLMEPTLNKSKSTLK